MTFRRAVKEDQKKQRRESILNGAADLFSRLSWDQVSLNGIAREAGFTKSNVYRYFSSKDEIFLTLLEDDFHRFENMLIAKLQEAKSESIESFAVEWRNCLTEHQRLLKLIPQLSLSMEKNSSKPAIKKFKLSVHQINQRLSRQLMELFPRMDEAGCHEFIMLQIALIAGLYPMAQYSPLVAQALDELGMEYFQLNFFDEIERATIIMLRGLLS